MNILKTVSQACQNIFFILMSVISTIELGCMTQGLAPMLPRPWWAT